MTTARGLEDQPAEHRFRSKINNPLLRPRTHSRRQTSVRGLLKKKSHIYSSFLP